MASIPAAATAPARPFRLLTVFRPSSTAAFNRPISNISSHSHSLSSRFKAILRSERKFASILSKASGPESSSGKSISKTSEVEAGDKGQSPPFLTVLAGFLVFLLVLWILGSTMIWLVGLLANLLPK